MKIPLVTTSSRVSCADVEIGVMNHQHDNIQLLLPSGISSDCPISMKEKTKNLHDQFHLEQLCYFWPDCLSSEIIQWDSIFSNFSHSHKHKSKYVTKVSHDFMFIYCLNTEVVAALYDDQVQVHLRIFKLCSSSSGWGDDVDDREDDGGEDTKHGERSITDVRGEHVNIVNILSW